MNKNSIFWLIIFVMVFLGGGLFISRQITNNNQNTVIAPTNSSVDSSMPDGTIIIKGYNYGFSPKNITVKFGETVNLRLVSEDSPHTFTIDELGVDQQFTWGKDTDLTFTASKKGTFKIYCAVSGHKESGMIGTLVVQ